MVGQELQPQVSRNLAWNLAISSAASMPNAKTAYQQVAVLVLAVFQATFQCSGFLLHMEGLIIPGKNIPAVQKLNQAGAHSPRKKSPERTFSSAVM